MALNIMFDTIGWIVNLLLVFTLLQNYFSCFFPLPIVISSLRWGLEAGRKTVVSPIELFA
jgi:hypothetical protein